MRKPLVASTVCVAAALCAALALAAVPRSSPAPARPPATPPKADRLVVHEWGTFTGIAGSDGVHLPVYTAVGVDLPGFVDNRLHDAQRRPEGREAANVAIFLKGFGAPALQRMETPVVYFYAERPTDVDVRVDLRGGMLTEFYPPVRAIGPAFGEGPGEPGSRSAAAAAATPTTGPAAAALRRGYPDSFLDWGKVRVVPRSAGGAGPAVPPVPNGNHYAEARDVDADLVQVASADGKTHEERFLFYRGLGNFELPVTLRALGGDRFELTNAGADAVRSAFLVEADGAGEPTRFARYENVAGRRELALPSAGAVPSGPGLAESLVAALVAEGLYEKEARAMVATWRSQWLGELGVRVLYTVPRAVTDGLLPLRLSPVPTETVRVLVGRIDVLTPEREARIGTLMRTAATMGKIPDADATALAAMGRFMVPAIERATKARGDASAAADAKALQKAFYEWQAAQRAAKAAAAAASAAR